MTALSCATKEDLLGLIKRLCLAHPEVRDDVKNFVPDLNVDQMVREIVAAARKIETKLPYDRYGRGNHDTYAYNRVKSFISAFAKVAVEHLKTVEKSGQSVKAVELMERIKGTLDEVPEFHDPCHNAGKKRVQAALEKVANKFDLIFADSACEDE
eukprot:UN4566